MQTLKTYPCGLRVINDYMPDRQVENVSFFVASGSGYDLKGKDGIAHFYEHMFFKSTKNRTSYQVNLELDSLGAGGNAYTGHDRTCYYSKVVNDKTEKLFDILSDCFFNGLFLEEEIKTEKGVVCSEIDRYKDDFLDCAIDAFNQEMFEGTSFAHPILGSKESVNSITAQDLKRYRQENNTPHRLIISTAGGVSDEEIERLVEKYVLPHLIGEKSPLVYKDTKQTKIQVKQHFVFTPKDTQQVYFLTGTPISRKDSPDFAKAQLASIIFGGTISSRLFQRLREKEGIVYTAQSMCDSLALSGVFNAFLITNKDTAKQAISAYKDEVQKVIDSGFTQEEVNQGKILIEANIKISNDSLDSRARRNASSILDKGIMYNSKEQIEKIRAISKDELNEYIKKVFEDENFLVSVVSKENNIDILELLK